MSGVSTPWASSKTTLQPVPSAGFESHLAHEEAVKTEEEQGQEDEEEVLLLLLAVVVESHVCCPGEKHVPHPEPGHSIA